jgi:hypothetical protein
MLRNQIQYRYQRSAAAVNHTIADQWHLESQCEIRGHSVWQIVAQLIARRHVKKRRAVVNCTIELRSSSLLSWKNVDAATLKPSNESKLQRAAERKPAGRATPVMTSTLKNVSDIGVGLC